MHRQPCSFMVASQESLRTAAAPTSGTVAFDSFQNRTLIVPDLPGSGGTIQGSQPLTMDTLGHACLCTAISPVAGHGRRCRSRSRRTDRRLDGIVRTLACPLAFDRRKPNVSTHGRWARQHSSGFTAAAVVEPQVAGLGFRAVVACSHAHRRTTSGHLCCGKPWGRP